MEINLNSVPFIELHVPINAQTDIMGASGGKELLGEKQRGIIAIATET